MKQQQKEHRGVRHTVDKMQDTLGGIAGRMIASTIAHDDSFVEHATLGDMYEIEAAELALARSSQPEVKVIAAKMIADHWASTHHLQAALEMNETRGVAPPPTQLDTRRRKMLEHLRAAPADKLDAAYLDQQVLAHDETATLLRNYRDKGDNPQLRSYAAATIPVVERHLHHMKDLRLRLAS